jgi:hypothetical protein
MNSVTGGGGLERFRSYLWLLVEIQFYLRRQGMLDPSGMVPQALLQAPKAEAGLHGKSDQEKAAWLRQIRARNLANALRDLSREKRVKLISENPSFSLSRKCWRARVIIHGTSHGQRLQRHR